MWRRVPVFPWIARFICIECKGTGIVLPLTEEISLTEEVNTSDEPDGPIDKPV